MITIDITNAVLRDSSHRDPEWPKPYVDWLIEHVGERVKFDYGTAMDQGDGWKLYQHVDFSGNVIFQRVLVDIDDPNMANFFILRWL